MLTAVSGRRGICCKMFFIGGINSGYQELRYNGSTVICGRCGAYGRYTVFMTYMVFSFFFIPLFKWNRRYYVKMSCCGSVYELNPEVGAAIARGEEREIREEDLTLRQDGDLRWNKPPRRCPSCGFETGEDYDYCPKCGNRLE